MGKITLRYEQIDIRARLRNELNSYLEVSLYLIYFKLQPFSFLLLLFFFSVNQISHSLSSFFGRMPCSASSILQTSPNLAPGLFRLPSQQSHSKKINTSYSLTNSNNQVITNSISKLQNPCNFNYLSKSLAAHMLRNTALDKCN